jgi:hypothetical protein
MATSLEDFKGKLAEEILVAQEKLQINFSEEDEFDNNSNNGSGGFLN